MDVLAPGSAALRFARELRAAGLAVTPGRALDAARALTLVDVLDANAVRAALRTTLTTSVDDFPAFDAAFDRFWLGRERNGAPAPPPSLANQRTREAYALVPGALEGVSSKGDARLPGAERTASETEVLTHKDFRDYRATDLPRARRLAAQLAPALATDPSRRYRPAPSGETDVRRSVRGARRTLGEVVSLERRRRKLRRLRVVVLCDVSGSMDTYARHLLLFFHALQARPGDVRTFVFSTRLQEVTPLLRRRRYADALTGLAAAMPAWSGGTTIGACLAAFNSRYAKQLLGPRTVVIVASDGWERGEPGRLAHELGAIRRRARTVIWLNPLKAREGYEPLAAGMAAALPHVDHFLAANNLAALARLGRLLAAG